MAHWFPVYDIMQEYKLSDTDKKIQIMADAVAAFSRFLADEDERLQHSEDKDKFLEQVHPSKPSNFLFHFNFSALAIVREEVDDTQDARTRATLRQRLANEVYLPLSHLHYPDLGVDYHRLGATANELLSKNL